MKKSLGQLSLVSIQIISLFTFPMQSAWAVSNPMGGATKYDEKKIQTSDVNVDDFCNQFINGDAASWTGSNSKKSDDLSPPELSGDPTTWPAQLADYKSQINWPSDQWCADHGSITDAAVGPTSGSSELQTNSFCNAPITCDDLDIIAPMKKKQDFSLTTPPGPTPAPTPIAAAGQCPVSNADRVPDVAAKERVCRNIDRNLIKCKFRHSQVETHCMGRQALKDHAHAFDGLLGLDTAAAVACTSACVASIASAGILAGATESACTLAGSIASLVEVIRGNELANSPISNMLTTVGALAGAAGTAGTAVMAVDSFKNARGFTEAKFESKPGGTEGKVLACATAGFYVMFAVVRGVNANNASSAIDEEDEKIRKFISDSNVATGAGVIGANVNTRNYTPGNGTAPYGSGSDANSGSGGNGPKIGQGSGSQVSGTGTTGQVLQVAGATAETPDGRVLKQSGLDKALADLAKQLKASGALKNHDAAAAIGQAVGGMGEVGAAMATLAAETKRDPSFMAQAAGSGSTYAGGSGGAGGGGSKSDASNPFANLFGAKDSGGGASSTGQANFGSRAPANDIWHTGTTQNLFEIVSGKVSQVASRVMAK